jgi:hypothetical protein
MYFGEHSFHCERGGGRTAAGYRRWGSRMMVSLTASGRGPAPSLAIFASVFGELSE